MPSVVILPLQLSVAVSADIAGTPEEQDTVTSAGASGAIGLVLS